MKHPYPLMLFFLIILFSATATAQSNLNPGDIAITTYNTTGAQNFSFITFVTIQKDTKVYFTDRGWDTTTNDFGTAPEGTIMWTAANTIPAFTEVIIEDLTGNINANIGSVSESGNFELAATGDQILVYQEGNGTIPNFIYTFNRGREILEHALGLRTFSAFTMLPAGLTLNVNLFSTTSNKQNWQYKCTEAQTGNKESLLSFFMQLSNYRTSDQTAYNTGALSQNGCSFMLTNEDKINPVIHAQTFGLREDAPNGYAIGVPAVDDASNTQFTNWRIVGGTDQDKFTINNSTGVITVKDRSTFDFENINTRNYYIYVEVDDISGNSSESSVANGKGEITITMEDYASAITVMSASRNVLEGNTGVFTFTISKPSIAAIDLSIVSYAGTATPVIDYKKGPDTVIIPANQSSVIVGIETILDAEDETDESVVIIAALSGFSNDITINGVEQFTIKNQKNTLSIANNQLSKAIKIYPNPSTGLLYLDSDGQNALEYAEVFTLKGKLLKTIPLDALERQRIDISAMANGIYMLKIYSKNKGTALKKFFKL